MDDLTSIVSPAPSSFWLNMAATPATNPSQLLPLGLYEANNSVIQHVLPQNNQEMNVNSKFTRTRYFWYWEELMLVSVLALLSPSTSMRLPIRCQFYDTAVDI